MPHRLQCSEVKKDQPQADAGSVKFNAVDAVAKSPSLAVTHPSARQHQRQQPRCVPDERRRSIPLAPNKSVCVYRARRTRELGINRSSPGRRPPSARAGDLAATFKELRWRSKIVRRVRIARRFFDKPLLEDAHNLSHDDTRSHRQPSGLEQSGRAPANGGQAAVTDDRFGTGRSKRSLVFSTAGRAIMPVMPLPSDPWTKSARRA